MLLVLFTPLMPLLSGCEDDRFLDAIHQEEDFIAPYDVNISESEVIITTYFNIADDGYPESLYPGDDGSYKDIPNARSFIEKHDVTYSGYIVEDNVTGLTWTKCTADGINSMKTTQDCSGSDAVEMSHAEAVDTCKSLNSLNSGAGYAGYNDWRLPHLAELFTLVYFGDSISYSYADRYNFPDTVISSSSNPAYWTSKLKLYYASGSTTMLNEYGWVVYFSGGGWWKLLLTNFVELVNANTGAVANKGYVRCVRGGGK